jgi:hypothetical protein
MKLITTQEAGMPAQSELQVAVVTLAELEAEIIERMAENGVTQDKVTKALVGKHGSPTVDAGQLSFYTADVWGSQSKHRWISAAVLTRIAAALPEAPEPERQAA